MTKDNLTAKTILESIPEAVFMVDKDQNITFINARAAEFAGTSPEKSIGKKCQAVFGGHEGCDLKPCFGKKPSTVEVVFDLRTEDGAVRHFSLRAAPVKSKEGDAAALAVVDDVTHVRELEARADEMHDSTMELALGISECFGVLDEVEKGNLKVRVGESTLSSPDELMASLARALNKTIEGVDNNIETISRMQQMVIQELSTPLLQIWEGVIVLPVIGVVDTRRSAQIMERMLAEIVARQARYVILDITGVEVVDTRTADHFIKVVKASSLLGAKCIITGIRPAVAQTLVDIGVDLSSIKTLGNLREGLAECIRRLEREKAVKAVREEGK
ncbi:MAG: PAS domain S-box protein [Deltaproteobacteria bacterium]|nr:PAS domain S-box protein [Deltaproteobacteria bacterium]